MKAIITDILLHSARLIIHNSIKAS